MLLRTDLECAHLHDVPPDGGLGHWDSDSAAEVTENKDFERRLIHHVEEHPTTDRHIAL